VEKIKASVDAVLKANQQQAQDLAEHATKMEHFGELIVRMDERQQNFASRMDERQQSFAKVVDELKSDMKDLRRGSGKTR
jgi:methyl-accepting chemotaxis protein